MNALDKLSPSDLQAALTQVSGSNNANAHRTMTDAGRAFGNALSARLDQVRGGSNSVSELASRDMTGFRVSAGSSMTYGFGGMSPAAFHASNGESTEKTGLSGGDGGRDISEKLSVWTRGIGVFSSNNGDGQHAGFDRTTAGGLAGGDLPITPNFRVGAAVGFARSDVIGKDGNGNEAVDSYYVGLYSGWTPGKWFLDNNLGFSFNKVETKRALSFGLINRTATGTTNGYDVSLETKGGYRFTVNNYTLEPSLSLRYDLTDINSYTESGADALDLTVQGQKRNFLRSGLGGRIIRTFALDNGMVLEPELRVRWEHDILDAGTKTTQWIGDQQFTATSAKAGRDAGVFGAGIAAIIDKDMRLYAHYDSEVRANQIDHIVTAGFRYSW
ncbi:MAG: autotransporter outer membrane beta-barrel domain-containing protein [Rhodospirillaceae bacterium]